MLMCGSLTSRTKDGRTKARMLVPAWLAGTVLGKGASHISAANARAGAFMRFAPSGDHTDRTKRSATWE